MPDSVDKLSAATGLRPDALLPLWAEVSANHERLAACPRHDFPDPEPGRLGLRYTCRACGGLADGSSVVWYRRGLSHGGGAHG